MTRQLLTTRLAAAACWSLMASACSKDEMPARRPELGSAAASSNPPPAVGRQGQTGPTRRGAGSGTSEAPRATRADGAGDLEAEQFSDAGAPNNPVKVGDFGVLCLNTSSSQVETPQFSMNLYLVNKTTKDVPLERLTVRYFFTEDHSTETEHRVFIDYAGVLVGGSDNVTTSAAAWTPPEATADRFVEIGFAKGLCKKEPCVLAASSKEEPDLNASIIKVRVQIQPTALRYKLDNDYSYTPQRRVPSQCPRLVMYDEGRIVFGVQPDGATKTAAPEQVDGGLPDAGTARRGAVDGGGTARGPDASTGARREADAGEVTDGGTRRADAAVGEDAAVSAAGPDSAASLDASAGTAP